MDHKEIKGNKVTPGLRDHLDPLEDQDHLVVQDDQEQKENLG